MTDGSLSRSGQLHLIGAFTSGGDAPRPRPDGIALLVEGTARFSRRNFYKKYTAIFRKETDSSSRTYPVGHVRGDIDKSRGSRRHRGHSPRVGSRSPLLETSLEKLN